MLLQQKSKTDLKGERCNYLWFQKVHWQKWQAKWEQGTLQDSGEEVVWGGSSWVEQKGKIKPGKREGCQGCSKNGKSSTKMDAKTI